MTDEAFRPDDSPTHDLETTPADDWLNFDESPMFNSCMADSQGPRPQIDRGEDEAGFGPGTYQGGSAPLRTSLSTLRGGWSEIPGKKTPADVDLGGHPERIKSLRFIKVLRQSC